MKPITVDVHAHFVPRLLIERFAAHHASFPDVRMTGWISHWKEIAETPKQKIHRPRQIYVGNTERKYAPIAQRS